MKYFTFGKEKCNFYISTYANNGRIYIGIDTKNGKFYCDVTVNLPFEEIPGNDYAFIDTANTPELEKFLTKKSFATKLPYKVNSGYNTYNLYKLNLKKIWLFSMIEYGV